MYNLYLHSSLSWILLYSFVQNVLYYTNYIELYFVLNVLYQTEPYIEWLYILFLNKTSSSCLTKTQTTFILVLQRYKHTSNFYFFSKEPHLRETTIVLSFSSKNKYKLSSYKFSQFILNNGREPHEGLSPLEML